MTTWSTRCDGVLLEVAVLADPPGDERLSVRATCDDVGEPALERMFAALRHASSQAELSAHGVAGPYRIEDATLVEAAVGAGDVAMTERWLRRRLSRETDVRARPGAGAAEVHATLARRGTRPTSQRRRYERVAGKIRVEAFELHVVEHCNLRCAHCCNMSPYLAEHTASVAEIEAMCRTMAEHLDVDVFKIMGGEPLLHPDITGVLHAIRRARISETVRLFTNGLLLHRQGDDFWRALDQLTISNYASAPVKPALLAAARAKAREFDVVLNVKPVGEFSEVMRAAREGDDDAVERTFTSCWLRHRCLVVRRGKFYMCTRAAYAEEFHAGLMHHAHPDDRDGARAGDGVALDTPDLGAALLEYLNREAPLVSCRFCHGGAGPVLPHTQLARADVQAGRLVPLRVTSS